MATLATLRKEAKGLGIPAAKIRQARDDRDALQELIDNFNSNGTSTSSKKRGAVKKAVAAKKKSAKKTPKRAPARKASAKTAQRKPSPAKSRTSGKAKRTTTATADSGRYTLDGVNFSETDGWNAREGSGPDRIVKALRKFRGDRTKAFEYLLPSVWDFVGRKKRDGSKRSKSDALAMLKYRISRTAFDFAIATGQHESSSNRVEYGTGGTGQGVWKPAGKRASAKRSAAPKRAAAKKSTAKRSTAKRGAQKRAAAKRGSAKRATAKRTTAKRGSSKRKSAKR
jgi:hypothetical protein